MNKLKRIILVCMLLVVMVSGNALASRYTLFRGNSDGAWAGIGTLSIYGETNSIRWVDNYKSKYNGTVKAISFDVSTSITYNAGFGTTEYPVPGSYPVYVYLKGGNSFYAECSSFPDLESTLNKNAFSNNFVKMMRSYAPEAYNKLQGKVRQMPSPEKLAQVKKPDSRVLFMGHKYAIFKGKLTWWEAEAYCESMGGHLATITSQAEQDFIDNHLNIDGARLWIGGYRPEGLGFAWITGEPWNYTNWDIGEPNNSSNVVAHEDSVCLWPRKWNDLSYRNTSEQNGFVCEWDK